MQTRPLEWNRESICLRASSPDAATIAAEAYARTCRTDFDEPGFCVINAGRALSSTAFRQLMVDLKEAMGRIHEARTGDTFLYLSAARFDQQQSTRLHLDGGPEECFLMLGYEPSRIDSELEIADSAKCAFDLGLSPQEFLAKHNPMFQAGYELLRPYLTRIPCFSPDDFQIVCINNSSAPYRAGSSTWQGVLHTATIKTPDESQRRVINSTMIAPAAAGTADNLAPAEIETFIRTSEVHRRGYDKPHLEDDR